MFKTIILFLYSLCFLFVSCQKNRTIPKNETDEPEQVVQREDLEQAETELNDSPQVDILIHEIPIRERTALPFIEAVKSGDRNKIVSFLCYPMPRPFPLPYIKNEQEMLARFDMIFTTEVLSDIANSSDHEWSLEAWRGIVFYNGRTRIWMNYDGTVFDIPVSNQEEELADAFWEKDRERLLPEFRGFGRCVGLYASPTYLLRLDAFATDDEYCGSYRALFWERKNAKTMSDMPDIILTDGEVQYRGSSRDSWFYFIDNDKFYVIWLERLNMYRDEGELFIGEYTEDFDPHLYNDHPPLLQEKIMEKGETK